MFELYIGLATKWLRILAIPPNDKIRNHLVAKPILSHRRTKPSSVRNACSKFCSLHLLSSPRNISFAKYPKEGGFDLRNRPAGLTIFVRPTVIRRLSFIRWRHDRASVTRARSALEISAKHHVAANSRRTWSFRDVYSPPRLRVFGKGLYIISKESIHRSRTRVPGAIVSFVFPRGYRRIFQEISWLDNLVSSLRGCFVSKGVRTRVSSI